MKRLLFILLLSSNIMLGQDNTQQVPTPSKDFEDVVMPYVEDILEAAKQGANFVIDEVPEVIMQYVIYYAVVYWLTVLLSIIMVVLAKPIARKLFAVKGMKNPIPKDDENFQDSEPYMEYVKPNLELYNNQKYFKRLDKKYFIKDYTGNDATAEILMYYLVRWILPIIGLILFFNYINDAIKATFFPKLFIVERFLEHI